MGALDFAALAKIILMREITIHSQLLSNNPMNAAGALSMPSVMDSLYFSLAALIQLDMVLSASIASGKRGASSMKLKNRKPPSVTRPF